MTSALPRPRPSDVRAVAALAAVAVFLVAWGLVHRGFWSHGVIVDWPTYEKYGAAMTDGRVPYRDFAVEYPPGALPMFVLPSLVSAAYDTTFAWLMCLCGAALVTVVAWFRPVAGLYVAVSPLLVGSLVLSRFDLWPALLATAAVVLLVRGRHRSGWAFLGAAVVAKIWPLVLVPLAVAWSVRRGRPLAPLAGLALAAAVVVPFALVAPHGLWESVNGQASRPLQIESLGAALFTTFAHPQIVSSHGSQNIVGHGVVAVLFSVLQAAVLLALWIAFARGPATGERFVRYGAAAVCAFIALGKVLSPQYLVWLVPLVPLVRGRRGLTATALLTLALVLTQVWFPQRYFDYALKFELAGVVLARDLVLVALLAVLALPWRGSSFTLGASPSRGGAADGTHAVGERG
jgi:Glycosyltransferase family 87